MKRNITLEYLFILICLLVVDTLVVFLGYAFLSSIKEDSIIRIVGSIIVLVSIESWFITMFTTLGFIPKKTREAIVKSFEDSL